MGSADQLLLGNDEVEMSDDSEDYAREIYYCWRSESDWRRSPVKRKQRKDIEGSHKKYRILLAVLWHFTSYQEAFYQTGMSALCSWCDVMSWWQRLMQKLNIKMIWVDRPPCQPPCQHSWEKIYQYGYILFHSLFWCWALRISIFHCVKAITTGHETGRTLLTLWQWFELLNFASSASSKIKTSVLLYN